LGEWSDGVPIAIWSFGVVECGIPIAISDFKISEN